jgi:hypothetical protein
MKVRTGFVSNSSSSSFIVIGNGDHLVVNKPIDHLIIPGTFGGQTCFGWEDIQYDTFGDRLNWATLCALYQRDTGDFSWLDMLTEVLREELNLKSYDIEYNFSLTDSTTGEVFGYIDHQSTHLENPENGVMFASKQALKDWLFAINSYIQGGNDN